MNAGDVGPRLDRIEEHAAFTERTVEQLGEEIAEINRRVRELLKRLEGLESRLGRVADAVDQRRGATTDPRGHESTEE